MSYCRCSGDDSNVYVLGTGGGWEIYVQAGEMIGRGDILDEENWRIFPHKEAGKYYMCKTRQECLDELLRLRDDGIMVPDRALDRLRTEIERVQTGLAPEEGK